MKAIDREKALFGDLYYNATRDEVKKLASDLQKYPISSIAAYLKVIMQDILGHLAGLTSFMDACMVRDKLHFESKINNKLGKRKLVELISLLEELDNYGIHMDDVIFPTNDNDEFLRQIIKDRRKGILQDYLSISTLNEFFDMVMMVVTIMPMARRIKEFDAFIPNPVNFDFKNKYYPSIDYLLYYMDNDRHDSLMNKHEEMGREINLIEWINNYKNRYAIKDLLREEMGIKTEGFSEGETVDDDIKKDILDDIANFARDEYDFSDDELEHLEVIAKEKIKEIYILKKQVLEMRESIKMILKTQDIDLNDKEYEKLEDEFVMETFIKHATKKTRMRRGVIFIIFSAIIASLVLIPSFHTSKEITANDKVREAHHVAMDVPKDKENDEKPDIPKIDEEEDDQKYIEIILPEKPNLEEVPDSEMVQEDDDAIYKTDFVIGETVSGNVPFYISSTSDEILGFLNEDMLVIGYFATLEGKDGMSILCSCRNQEQMEKFLRLYHGDGKEIIWRAAVTKASNERVLEYLANGEEIPYELTTCYIDCEPAKELSKIRGK
ncbi:MAG: hypothetical protein OSJ70_10935 [Bacilli bacterium]|nr:hypothetical protein [Bacilli bacterium]